MDNYEEKSLLEIETPNEIAEFLDKNELAIDIDSTEELLKISLEQSIDNIYSIKEIKELINGQPKVTLHSLDKYSYNAKDSTVKDIRTGDDSMKENTSMEDRKYDTIGRISSRVIIVS